MEKHVINPALARFVNLLYARLLYDVTEYQKDNLTDSSYIFAPNHSSNLDGYIIWALLAKDYDIDVFMYKEFWDNFPTISKFLPLFNVYPITRDKIHPNEILTELKKLKDPNHSLVIFPQGRHVAPEIMSRLEEYHLKTIPYGAFYISTKSDKPLVPVFIEPLELGNNNTVIYGTPLYPQDFTTSKRVVRKDELKEFTSAWLEELNTLYQQAPSLIDRSVHEYHIKKTYSDASGLRYKALQDPNRVITYMDEIEELIELHQETGITDISKLGESTNISSSAVDTISDVNKVYRKCLVRH